MLKNLDISNNYPKNDCKLIGLVSTSKEFKIAWIINNSLDVSLIKADNEIINLSNGSNLSISHLIYKRNKGFIRLDKDPFFISFLNFKKDQNFETKIKFNGYRDSTKKFFLNSIKLDENKNIIEVSNVQFSSKLKIKSIDSFYSNYIDDQNQKNIFDIKKNKKKYVINGDSFNGESLL